MIGMDGEKESGKFVLSTRLDDENEYSIWHEEFLKEILYIPFKYPVRWQKLLGSARSGSTALSYRNCVITPVGG